VITHCRTVGHRGGQLLLRVRDEFADADAKERKAAGTAIS